MPLYDIGDTVKLTFLVRVDDVLTNATLVTLTVTRPDGTTVSPAPTVANPSTGTYTAVVGLDAAGQWLWRFVATGPGGAPMTAEDGSFDVQSFLMPTLYATVEELRDELGDTTNQTLDTGLLEKAVRATSRAIDDWTGRRFWLDPAPSVREFTVVDSRVLRLPDVGAKTGFVVKTGRQSDGTYASTWAATGYLLWPLNADADGGAYSWTQLRAATSALPLPMVPGWPTVQVTARWGWSQIPPQVNEATILKAVSLFKRKEAPWGIAGFNEFGPVRISTRDGDVIDLLQNFERAGFGANL
jgi:hypothetical protein